VTDGTQGSAPAIESMTGFGQATVHAEGSDWQITVKSVNHKHRDLRLRLPADAEALEVWIRAQVAARVERGSLTVSLSTIAPEAEDAGPDDRALLPVIDLHRRLRLKRLPGSLALHPSALPRDAGRPTQPAGLSQAARQRLERGIDQALDQLLADRRREGAALKAVLDDQVERIADLTERIATAAEAAVPALHQRLHDRIAELLGGHEAVDPGRLAQEVAQMAVRADIREELDRLRAHVTATRDLLSGGGAIGRRLEFLAQEFHREANTIGAKAATPQITALDMDLKLAVDRVREQAGNVQ